jgi:spore maturation protein CgeB
MKNYNYIHASISSGQIPDFNPTHVNISSEEKWDLLSKSKVSIAMNLAPIYPNHIEYIQRYDNWQGNEAFKLLESGHIPQFKPRVIESMMCKTLVLVRYDDWNVIEKWFEPGKHFIYWYNLEDLFYKLYHVVNNYKSYQPIVDAAYDKVQEYEIERIYEKIVKGEHL